MALSAAEQEAIAARVTKLRDGLIKQFFIAFGNAAVMNAAVMNDVAKEFNSQFMYAARKRMQQLAEQAGEEFANALADQIKAGMKLAQD